MKLKQPAVAGTLESSDIQVRISPNPGKGLEINIESIVKAQYGDAILDTVKKALADNSISDAVVYIVDKGALDCVIYSRMQTAICRSAGTGFDWKGVNAR
jgi:citrate lyase subunit gamma (acyl carrier protein)